MRKLFFYIPLSALLLSCGQIKSKDNKEVAPVIDSLKKSVSDPMLKSGWQDSLIIKYVRESDNELVRSARKDSIPMEWISDRTEYTDSATYFIFQLGHSFENKFITDAWLYIDSVKRNIYEYDVANDKLIK